MRTDVPIYMKLSHQFVISKEEDSEIDEQVLAQIKNLNLNFNNYT